MSLDWLANRPKKTQKKPILITIGGESTEVYPADIDDFAKVTPNGQILWNESKMSPLSDSAKKLVIVHERSHSSRYPLFKALTLTPLLSWVIGTLGWGAYFLYVGVGDNFVSHGLTLILLLPIALAFTWGFAFLDEFLADYQAMSELGESQFVVAFRETQSSTDEFRSNLFIQLVYPPLLLTRSVYRLVNYTTGSN